jgi:hypothetical protein
MGQITGRFFVTAIADGMTIHGSLTTDKSLVQRWSGAIVIPDWTQAANQPTITLTVYRGAELANLSYIEWFYNGVKVTSSDNRFVIGNSGGKPTIKIVKNLASSTNADIDIISVTGKVESNGNAIEFSSSIDIKLGYVSGSGYVGVVEFLDNSDITVNQPSVTLIPRLYKENGEVAQSSFTKKWFFNDATEITSDTSVPGVKLVSKSKDGVSYSRCLEVGEKAVTDYSIVRCDFYVGSEKVTTERVGIDDTVDEEYLWIANQNAECKSASITQGQTATFKMWVATKDDPAESKYRAQYTVYRITAYNSQGDVISGYDNKVITAADGDYKCGLVSFDWNFVNTNGGDISVVVSASNQ